MKLSSHTRDAVILWSGCYVLLFLHASLISGLSKILVSGLLTPLAPAIGMGLFQYHTDNINPHMIDDSVENIFGENRYDAIMNIYKCIPVAFSFYVIFLAQMNASYDEYTWWVIVMLMLTGSEMGLYFRYSRFK